MRKFGASQSDRGGESGISLPQRGKGERYVFLRRIGAKEKALPSSEGSALLLSGGILRARPPQGNFQARVFLRA